MKTLQHYITEKILINKNSKIVYNYHPKTKDELQELVKKLIKERGNDADLNDIDTSAITDMTEVFYQSSFNGDISNWNVSKVKDMRGMFFGSNFNGDLSRWDVSKVKIMTSIFHESPLHGKEPDWYKK